MDRIRQHCQSSSDHFLSSAIASATYKITTVPSTAAKIPSSTAPYFSETAGAPSVPLAALVRRLPSLSWRRIRKTS